MSTLFEAARHEPLTQRGWDEPAARAAVRRIADRALAELDPLQGWPGHPNDDLEQPDQRFHDLYMGAGGVVWALRHLAGQGAIGPLPGLDGLVDALPERNRAALAGSLHGSASYLMGDTGLGLLQWRQRPDAALAQRLFDTIQANLHNPANEQLWGNAGTAMAAIHLAEATGQARWAALLQQAAQALHDDMVVDAETGTWLWQQQLYGRPPVRYLGAGHGLVGNAYPVLRGAALLPAELVADITARTLATLQALALHEDGAANWHPMSDRQRVAGRLPLQQDCHGSAGIVSRLARHVPRSAAWDALLLAGGEAVWRAGPLVKGPGLCHGTAGNGFALLKLWRRSGDERWLARARAFAMHAIGQVEVAHQALGRGRQSLWTGDPGVACYLWQCVQGGDAFPTLDLF